MPHPWIKNTGGVAVWKFSVPHAWFLLKDFWKYWNWIYILKVNSSFSCSNLYRFGKKMHLKFVDNKMKWEILWASIVSSKPLCICVRGQDIHKLWDGSPVPPSKIKFFWELCNGKSKNTSGQNNRSICYIICTYYIGMLPLKNVRNKYSKYK